MLPSNRLGNLSLNLVVFSLLLSGSVSELTGQELDSPQGATEWPELSSRDAKAYVHKRNVWLQLSDSALKNRRVAIPRLCAPVRAIRWQGQPKAEIKFWPEPEEWVISWKSAPDQAGRIELVFDAKPVLPQDCPTAVPAGDGSVMLHAFQASTFGEKLRFEPQWYKNTVGYWAVGTDYATWKLAIDQPGTYSVAVLQGCGKGQGGSDAVISLRQDGQVKAQLPFQTTDTGHFQNFRWQHLGAIEVANPGAYQLRIDATRIAKVALFDVRMIHLVRQAAAATDAR